MAVAITIDDFTYPIVVSDALVPILEKNPNLKLTAFPIGDHIGAVNDKLPGWWQDWLSAGHEIGYHSMHHNDLGKYSTDDLLKDIGEFNRTVEQVLDGKPFMARYGRPPFGNYGDVNQFVGAAQRLGMTWVLWSKVPSSADAAPLDYINAITPGDIALFHIRWQDMTKLQPYIDACQQRGLSLLSLSDFHLVSTVPAPGPER